MARRLKEYVVDVVKTNAGLVPYGNGNASARTAQNARPARGGRAESWTRSPRSSLSKDGIDAVISLSLNSLQVQPTRLPRS